MRKKLYRCPECASAIVWSLRNGREGSRAPVTCSNNLTASRLDWKPSTKKFCTWVGSAVRQKDGSVKLFNSGGISLLR